MAAETVPTVEEATAEVGIAEVAETFELALALDIATEASDLSELKEAEASDLTELKDAVASDLSKLADAVAVALIELRAAAVAEGTALCVLEGELLNQLLTDPNKDQSDSFSLFL